MTDLKKPLSGVEKRTAKQAYDAIESAVASSLPRLSTLLAASLKACSKDFASADIGRWHVIDGFLRGYRGEIPVGHLHRHYDGFIQAVIAGAGFADEKPGFDISPIAQLADEVAQQRQAWRSRQ